MFGRAESHPLTIVSGVLLLMMPPMLHAQTCPPASFDCAGNDALCDDGQFCTGDFCIGNICHCKVNNCDDNQFCTDDVCNEEANACEHTATTNCQAPTPYCNENLNRCVECASNSDCARACYLGPTPGVACAVDAECGTGGRCLGACNPDGDCVQCISNGQCDDGLFCNGQESCNFSTGFCETSAPPTCTKHCFFGPTPGASCTTDGNCGAGGECRLDYCSELRDKCVQCEVNASCDNGAFCDGAEGCVNDVCATGTPPVCKRCVGGSQNLLPCATDLDCGNPPGAGTCTGAATYCDVVSDDCVQCLNPSHCEDLNYCTTNSCVFNSCTFSQNPAICSDGAWCNGDEVCNYQIGNLCSQSGSRTNCCFKGTCSTSNPPKGCNSNLDCPAGMGTCNNSTAPSCNADHSACTRDCADPITCTVDSCNETIDSCQHTANNALCPGSNLLCDGTETCEPGTLGADPTSGCKAGTPIDCSVFAGDPECSEGTCIEQPQVHCQANPINQGGSCNDDDVCTALSKCNNGFCVDNPPASNDPYRCVKLEWRPASVSAVLAGSTVELGLYAVANGCNQPTAFCPGTSLEVSSIDGLFSWNSSLLQLQPATGPEPNPEDPCVQADSCRTCPANEYPWEFSGWVDDCGEDGDHLNEPCNGDVPANDGKARYFALQGPVCSKTCRGGSNNGIPCPLPTDVCPDGVCSDTYCIGGSNNGLPCSMLSDCPSGIACTNLPPPACATTTGLHVTTIKFKAISGGTSEVSLLPCFGENSKTQAISPINAAGVQTNDVTKSLGPAVTITVTCDSHDDCNDNNACTGPDTCSCVTPACGGTCQRPNNSNTCDDGLFCTSNDNCGGGQCQGGSATCAAPLLCDETNNQCVQCLTVANCNDGLACTTDACVSGNCQHTAVNCNDNVACTTDACVEPAGTCTHTANHAFCNPTPPGPLFCSSVSCDPLQDCVFDHDCISDDGNPCPDPNACNETSNTCGGCNAPTVVTAGSRYLRVTPASQGSTPVALLVAGDCGDVNAACVFRYVQSKCNGGPNNGLDCLTDADCPKRCVGGLNPGQPCATDVDCPLGSCAGKCDAGTLGATPFYKTVEQWGTAKVRGPQIRAETKYMAHTECNFAGGAVQSSAASATTWRSGDVDGNGVVSSIDVAVLVAAFKGTFAPYTFEQLNISGCLPDDTINALDITFAVDANRGIAFPCSVVCP